MPTALRTPPRDALTFILSHRASARNALSEFLKDDAGQPLSVTNVKSQAAIENGAIPDLACLDEHDNVVAFIESKFWATLTDHQPVTYWHALSADKPSVLLFLAPHRRVESDSLWDELVDRLRKADVELDDVSRTDGLVTAVAKDGRRLMLTSWDVLLGHIAEAGRRDGDSQVCFEIAQLQGLAAAAAVRGETTTPDENLRRSFADAVDRLKRSGWANNDGLRVGTGANYFARYFRLAGAPAGLRIDYEDEKQRPEQIPLALVLGRAERKAGRGRRGASFGPSGRSGMGMARHGRVFYRWSRRRALTARRPSTPSSPSSSVSPGYLTPMVRPIEMHVTLGR